MYAYGQQTTVVLPYGTNPGGEEVLGLCEAHGIPLIPFFSLINSLAKANDKIAEIARRHHATAAQINLAWLLHHSPWILPIPGTSSLAHLQENLQAAEIRLTAEDTAYLR